MLHAALTRVGSSPGSGRTQWHERGRRSLRFASNRRNLLLRLNFHSWPSRWNVSCHLGFRRSRCRFSGAGGATPEAAGTPRPAAYDGPAALRACPGRVGPFDPVRSVTWRGRLAFNLHSRVIPIRQRAADSSFFRAKSLCINSLRSPRRGRRARLGFLTVVGQLRTRGSGATT
jgi:hypothetical protein